MKVSNFYCLYSYEKLMSLFYIVFECYCSRFLKELREIGEVLAVVVVACCL